MYASRAFDSVYHTLTSELMIIEVWTVDRNKRRLFVE